MTKQISRGQIWWTKFTLSEGGEIKKDRPAVVISNNHANQYLNRVQVIPITSNIKHCFSSEALIEVNGRICKALANQIQTADKSRLYKLFGEINAEDIRKIEAAILIQLDIA